MRVIFVLWALLFAAPAVAQVDLIGSYTWQIDEPDFGGFSAIEVRDDGASFIALSDRGHFATGQFNRVEGQIEGINLDGLFPLLGPDKEPLPHSLRDSEGLAIAGDGAIYVSFEWRHGIRRFGSVVSPGGELLSTPVFDALQNNSSLEALAIGPDGALYTIPERSGMATRPFPVFRLKAGIWDHPFVIPREGAFLIAGADIGPDGMLYILERDFIGIGFRSRVRRFDLQGQNGETLLTSGLRTHDNLEGISVWEDANGLRMTLISDDNFRSFQRTEIVEYRLTQ